VKMPSHRTAKDEIMILPGRASLELLFYLAHAVLFELLKGERGERDTTATLLSFRLRFNISPLPFNLAGICVSIRRTCSVPAAKFICRHLRGSSSPLRIPVASARTNRASKRWPRAAVSNCCICSALKRLEETTLCKVSGT
jgi:hypothetical protein